MAFVERILFLGFAGAFRAANELDNMALLIKEMGRLKRQNASKYNIFL